MGLGTNVTLCVFKFCSRESSFGSYQFYGEGGGGGERAGGGGEADATP